MNRKVLIILDNNLGGLPETWRDAGACRVGGLLSQENDITQGWQDLLHNTGGHPIP